MNSPHKPAYLCAAPYTEHFRGLSSYARTLDYYRIIYQEGPFEGLRYNERGVVAEIIDQVNYDYSLFEDPLPLRDLLDAFPLEAGYGVPDGSHEIGPFIRYLEMCRADHFSEHAGCRWGASYRKAIRCSAVGVGHGVTGTLTNVIASIVRTRQKQSTNIVTVAPNYCIAEDAAISCGLHARVLQCREEDKFLPVNSVLMALCDEGTAAMCITVPTNPSHDTWTLAEAHAVADLLKWCQDHEVFFVVDAIFQDQAHSNQLPLEPFVLSGSDRCLVKVFGPSKDRPFACGHRVGYYIGDHRIGEAGYQLSHTTLNSPNAYAKAWLAFDLFFRAMILQNRQPNQADCELFTDTFLFGEHFRDVGAREVSEIISSKGLFARYCRVVGETRAKLRRTMESVHDWVSDQTCFVTRELPKFGNSLFVKVSPEFYQGNDHEFFWDVLTKTNVGLLVGNAFGLPFPSDDVWFRIVCVSEEADTLVGRMGRIAAFLHAD